MNPILPSDKAKEICINWMKELDGNSFGEFLRQKGNGKMLGVLICTDNTVYKAYSGDTDTSLTNQKFVPPCYDQNKMKLLLEQANTELLKEEDKIAKREISRKYWLKIKDLYTFHCFDNSVRTLTELCPNAQSGTGDCCAPRLLSYCYQNGKKPWQLAEFYYGNGQEEHKQFYPPCDDRCKCLLKHILGLDIVYQDDDIVVVNKPSGLLSIEGRTEDKKDCVASRVRNLYNTIAQPCVHRLDMGTSGLMVLAKTQQAHDKLCSDFENRHVFKLYKAKVHGKVKEKFGIIDLPIRLDTENRPLQIVDFKQGKYAKTIYIKQKILNNDTILILHPKTGRTHQLRIHCAQGLKHPIIGDPLYGNGHENDILMLHSWILKFSHPVTGENLMFCEPCQNW